MSNSVELGLVLDTTQYMYYAIKDIKDKIKDILRAFPREKTLTIFVVSYNNWNESSIEKLERLDDTQINKCIKAPYKSQKNPTLQPIPVFTALNVALSYSWKAPQRILLLVGSNPPHGIQYHRFGKTFDTYPEGNPAYKLEETVRTIQKHKVDFGIINIGDRQNSGYGLETLANKFAEKLPNMKLKTMPAQMLTAQTMKEILGEIITAEKTQINICMPQDDEKNAHKFGLATGPTGTKIPILIIKRRTYKSEIWDGENVEQCLDYKIDTINYKHDYSIERLLKLSYDRVILFTKNMESLQKEVSKLKSQREPKESPTSQYHRVIRKALYFRNQSIKWIYVVPDKKKSKNTNGENVPVFIIQNKKPIIVADAYGYYHEIRTHAVLLDNPIFETGEDIAKIIDSLKTICGNAEWKLNMCDAAIKPGATKCRWKDSKSWTGAKKEGIITQITAIHKNHLTVEVRELSNTQKIHYLRSTEIEIGTRNDADQRLIKDLKRELSEKIGTLESLANGRDVYKKKAEKYKSLFENEKKELIDSRNDAKNKYTALQQTYAALEKQANSLKSICKSYEQEKKELNKKVTNFQKHISVKTSENEELNKKVTDLQKNISVKSSENEENEKLVSKLRERLLDTSSTLDFADGFPAVQDIIVHYDTTKTQFHFNASKLIKNSLKKNNKNLSKSEQLKNASKLLFDILIKSYKAMQLLEKEQHIKIANAMCISSDNKGGQKVVEKNMRKAHKNIFKINKIETEKAQMIRNECIEEHKLDQILQNDAKNSVLLYCGQCLQICWEIVLSRDPQLKLDPLTFESEEKIEFNDELYEAVGKSEIEERLNFVIWPSMVRTDGNYRLSKIIAVFLNKIPSGNAKKKKINKKPSELEAKNIKIDKKMDQESGSVPDIMVVNIEKD